MRNILRHVGVMAIAVSTVGAVGPIAAVAQTAQVMTVPGHADFLAVDGETVWVTNDGRMERWARDGKIAAVAMAKPCGGPALLGTDLWVADCRAGTLTRIDTRSATITATVATGIGNPTGELNVVAGAGSIWVASEAKGSIARVDPQTNRVIASIPVNPDGVYLSFGLGSLWVVSATSHSIQRIDPATNSVTKSTDLGKEPGFLIAGEGAVWVQEQGDGTVARIDAKTGEVTGRVKVGTNLKWGDIDAGGGKIWLRTTDDQDFVVIDPVSLAIVARLGKPLGSGGLRYTPAGIWTTEHDHHTLSWWPAQK